MTAKQKIEFDLKIRPGQGCTMYNGRDEYPYYVSDVIKGRMIIGLYAPETCCKTWADGVESVKPFDPSAKAEVWIRHAYGRWWTVSPEDGFKKRLRKFTDKYQRLSFDGARSYQDPSF